MGDIHVFMGLSESENADAVLKATVDRVWRSRLQKNQSLRLYSWNVQTFLPLISRPQVFVGFSFGANAALRYATSTITAGGVVSGVILLDPVDNDRPFSRNTLGFSIPQGVFQAWCFYRDARRQPWSGMISEATVDYYNKRYVPREPAVPPDVVGQRARADYREAAMHGQYVWELETTRLAQSLAGPVVTTMHDRVDVEALRQ